MYVPFEELPNSSRIWIYQSDRKLTDFEVKDISKDLIDFCQNWQAHKQNLNTSFSLKNNYFIVLAVDEQVTGASGCSIDSSLKKIKEIEQKYSISLLERHNLAFEVNDDVEIVQLSQLENQIKLKNLNSDSIFFNNLAASIGDLKSKWKVPAGTTWLNKYF